MHTRVSYEGIDFKRLFYGSSWPTQETTDSSRSDAFLQLEKVLGPVENYSETGIRNRFAEALPYHQGHVAVEQTR